MRIDHLVLAVPDLAAGVSLIGELTGVPPAPGGRHVGLGTANALVGLGEGRYLEIVGPDPDAPAPDGPRPFGLDGLTAPRLVTWAVRSRDLDADLATARAAGYDPGPSREMSRRTPGGALLSWRLTLAPDGSDTATVPFVIDWLDTPHPADSGLPELDLVAFEVLGPDPATRSALDALASDVPVVAAPCSGLLARLATPRGAVLLS